MSATEGNAGVKANVPNTPRQFSLVTHRRAGRGQGRFVRQRDPAERGSGSATEDCPGGVSGTLRVLGGEWEGSIWENP